MDEVDSDMVRYCGELMERHAKEPNQLYHYTSIEGLVGIASSNSFFLSDMLASADQSEIYHGIGVLKEVLNDNKGDPLADSVMQSFKSDALWWGIGTQIFEYAICFCETNDALTQWRGYSRNGGVAIGVNFHELVHWAKLAGLLVGKILYKRDAQREFLRLLFDRGRQHFDRLERIVATTPTTEPSPAFNDLLIKVSELFLRVVLFFKHDAFESETEWRVFNIRSADNPPHQPLKFRVRGSEIVPYVEMPFKSPLISEIRCSPGSWPRSVRYAIDRVAKSLGDVKVTESHLPL
jgi:hypothetical protein